MFGQTLARIRNDLNFLGSFLPGDKASPNLYTPGAEPASARPEERLSGSQAESTLSQLDSPTKDQLECRLASLIQDRAQPFWFESRKPLDDATIREELERSADLQASVCGILGVSNKEDLKDEQNHLPNENLSGNSSSDEDFYEGGVELL